MPLKTLVEQFAPFEILPIEIEDVRQAVLELSPCDHIRIRKHPRMEPSLLGIFYLYRKRLAVYEDEKICAEIVYSGQLSHDWQRVVCCKELIHALDQDIARTASKEQVRSLMRSQFQAPGPDQIGKANVMIIKDKAAFLQAIPILFPEAARAEALRYIRSGQASVEEIAREAELPASVVEFACSDTWEQLRGPLLEY